MKHQQTPNRWSCLPTSFAIVLDIPVSEMIERIGHDGSQLAFPTLREPECRRGFHIQECIDVALSLGVSVTPIEAFPRHAPAVDVNPILIDFPGGNEDRFRRTIGTSKGVLTGRGLHTQHAVAYDHNLIFDPNWRPYLLGTEDDPGSFSAYCAWRLA